MTVTEFKAWFEGFTAGIKKQPTAEQWDEIKRRVSALREGPGPADMKARSDNPYLKDTKHKY